MSEHSEAQRAALERIAVALRMRGMPADPALIADAVEYVITRIPAASDHPSPWRVGGRVPRNIYDANDRDIGRMNTAELAVRVVAAINEVEFK